MAVAASLFNAMRIPMVDFGRLLATKLLRYHSHGTQLGLALHLLTGIILAFIYALLIQPLLPGPFWLQGLTYGFGLWLTMMVIVLPAFGDGPFGWRMDRTLGPSALAVHLLYGLVLGFAFR